MVGLSDHAVIPQGALYRYGRMSKGTVVQKGPTAFLSKLWPFQHLYTEFTFHYFSIRHKFFTFCSLFMKQKYQHCFDGWLLQATCFGSQWWFCFPLHALTSHFWIVQKRPKLTSCNGSVDCCDRCGKLYRLWVYVPFSLQWDCVEKHYIYLPLPQTVMKNRTNHLLFNAQLVLCQFLGYSLVSGHQFTNFCSCFWIFSSWQLPTPCTIFSIYTPPPWIF